ncbi:MAG: hypothetical protein V4587_17850 [Acidobacteriota bacterium]
MAGLATLQQLLDPRELIPHYTAMPQILEYFFTKTFYDALSPRPTDSDSVRMISISATATPGAGNVRNGKARVLKPKGASERFFSMFRYFTEMPLEADALRALRELDSPSMQAKGREIVEMAQEESKILASLFKEVVLAQQLTVGRVNLDASGNILVPSVHATTGVITDNASTVISADFGVADTHRGNLNGTIAALWSVAGTKIPDQLEALDRVCDIAGVPRVKDIWLNPVCKLNLRNNTQFNDWAKYNTLRADEVLRGDGIEGLWGRNWHFVGGTWTDSGGTTRDLIPQTSGIFTPAIGPWLRAFAGSELIDTSNLITSDLLAALNSLITVYGPFAYGETTRNPTGLSYFQGDNFGLGFADPNAIWMPTLFA